RFGQIGDEKRLAPAGREHARYRLDAATVAVGLDDGGTFRRHRVSAQFEPVGYDRAKINREDSAGFGKIGIRAALDRRFRRIAQNGGFGLGHTEGFSRPASASPWDLGSLDLGPPKLGITYIRSGKRAS